MSLNVESASERVAETLHDADGRVWTADQLTEALRQAMADLSQVSGEALTLDGLDGAAATTLPVEDEGWLVLGAAGHAAWMQAIGRLQAFDLSPEVRREMLTWAGDTLARFNAGLQQVRARRLQASADAPYGAWEDADGVVG